jgi:hypothetical protein
MPTGNHECHPDVLPKCASMFGGIEAKIDNLQSGQDDKWAAINSMRADITAIRVAIAEHNNIYAEHRACQDRIAKLENTVSFSRGVAVALTMLGSAVGTLATLGIQWWIKSAHRP